MNNLENEKSDRLSVKAHTAIAHALLETEDYTASTAWLEAIETVFREKYPELEEQFMDVINICSNHVDAHHNTNTDK